MNMNKRAIWVWHSDAPHGGMLFRGNPNPPEKTPPYHFGDIENLLAGEELVCADTRRELEMESGVAEWNRRFKQFKVKPVCVIVEIHRHHKCKGE